MLTQKELSKRQGVYIDVSPDPMASTKIRAFMEEFPWVRKHVGGSIVQTYVSGVESSLLNYSPEQINVGLLEPQRISERILLLNGEGEVVTTEAEKKRKKFFFFGPLVSKVKKISGVVFYDSSVGSVANRLGEKADSVRSLLSYYGYTKAIIIYKLPQGVSLKQWIEREVELEKAKLQSEIAATK